MFNDPSLWLKRHWKIERRLSFNFCHQYCVFVTKCCYTAHNTLLPWFTPKKWVRFLMGPDQGGVTISAVDKYDNFHFTVDFLKVLRYSFLLPIVSPLSLAFVAENIKNLTLALHARENIWARLAGKCNFTATNAAERHKFLRSLPTAVIHEKYACWFPFDSLAF